MPRRILQFATTTKKDSVIDGTTVASWTGSTAEPEARVRFIANVIQNSWTPQLLSWFGSHIKPLAKKHEG